MVTNAEVQRMYREFNKKYFNNRLPKDMVVRFEIFDYAQGVTHFKYDRPLYIQISKKLKWSRSQTALTLLHEMVHVELPYRLNHGPRFHKRMMQLARAGAFKPWW